MNRIYYNNIVLNAFIGGQSLTLPRKVIVTCDPVPMHEEFMSLVGRVSSHYHDPTYNGRCVNEIITTSLLN